jgi:hypothetical protein
VYTDQADYDEILKRQFQAMKEQHELKIYLFSGKLVGAGTFGMVRQIIDIYSGQIFALKIPRGASEKHFKVIEKGIENLSFLQSGENLFQEFNLRLIKSLLVKINGQVQ